MAKAKAIMIQGTASGTGKSLLAAGLCRIFARDGLRVAPFKSQNMALNSYVTADGLEMGRAQVTQAQCAGVAPDVRMNPILLKPTSDSGSQVIVNGEVMGNMRAREYYAYKHKLVEPILAAYRSLAAENDVIVLEGAGSPAEINLKAGDIVNMGLAGLVKAPVLLAGDIDRGGVFAALAGTNLLLEPHERDLLKGVIINKFRGDPAILAPGLAMLEQLIHKPVLGVVPLMQVDIDDEDSLTDRFAADQRPGIVDIAVVRLPRIANFTDFGALSAVDGVSVRYITSPRELGRPDLVILPGSKNTMGDLLWLRQCGLEAAVLKLAAADMPILGICGGYQMLGRVLRDPEGLEQGGELAGMGLLPAETIFEPHKTRRQVEGSFAALHGPLAALSGAEIVGYEIHMGATRALEDCGPLTRLTDGRCDGMVVGNVCGSYLHGVLDSETAVNALLTCLLERKGLDADALRAEDPVVYRERQFDILEDTLRENLDMDRIYAILEEGIT